MGILLVCLGLRKAQTISRKSAQLDRPSFTHCGSHLNYKGISDFLLRITQSIFCLVERALGTVDGEAWLENAAGPGYVP